MSCTASVRRAGKELSVEAPCPWLSCTNEQPTTNLSQLCSSAANGLLMASDSAASSGKCSKNAASCYITEQRVVDNSVRH